MVRMSFDPNFLLLLGPPQNEKNGKGSDDQDTAQEHTPVVQGHQESGLNVVAVQRPGIEGLLVCTPRRNVSSSSSAQAINFAEHF